MRITTVSDDVHLVTGTNVNWALITEGTAVTVVDAGYPNDGAALIASLAGIGRRPQDVRAVVLTHAHLDHMGGIPTLLKQHQVPVLTGEQEARHAHRDYLEQISPVQMLGQCRRWAGAVWVAQTLRAVLPHVAMAIPQAAPVPERVPLDVPGRLVPVVTPGHTSGHTAYLMPSAGIVFSGDALVTDHPLLTGPSRPRLLPDVFTENGAQATASLPILGALPADTLVPGHGPVYRGSLRAVVDNLAHDGQVP
ncbi:MBL fold metallo-hydrolase [Actinoplanes sp. NPDC049596]|uniref:MBL fold metallo-hydrolase n=1 Tax=unclassified Actinoplanes TaxID=2626549 RepID=UPI00342F1CC3